MENQELLAKLTAAVEKLGGQVTAQPQAQQPAQQGFGLPTQPIAQPGFGMQPVQQPMGMPGAMPQATGVSVPVTVQLPDGRDLPLYVNFGPEAAQNLQGFAVAAAAAFGPFLKAYAPRQQNGGGYGGGGGNWGGGRGNYGRRW